jgi:hypothetical protein
MRPSTLGALLLVVSVAVAAEGCSDTINVTSPSQPSAPVTVTPEPVTETFAGSVIQGGTGYHAVLSGLGPVILTLTGIGPDPSVTIGMSIGVLNGVACSAVMDNTAATVGSQLIGTATGPTTLCVRIYDAGTVAADATLTYEVTVKYTK